MQDPEFPVESPAVISAEHAILKSMTLDQVADASWAAMRRRVLAIQVMVAVIFLLVIGLAWTIQVVAHNRARLDDVTLLADKLQVVIIDTCHSSNQVRTDIAELSHAALPAVPPPNMTPAQAARRLHLQELIDRVSVQRDCTQLVEGLQPTP